MGNLNYGENMKFLLSLLMVSTAFAQNAPPAMSIVEDGQAVIKNGVYEPGCYYGDSVSDHAPVIYGSLATWNIASPLSHWVIRPNPEDPSQTFLNHKFFTDDKANLMDKNGKKLGFLSTSEIILLKRKNQKGYGAISNFYIDRLNKVADAVKQFFKDNKDLQHVVLQEIPPANEKTIAGENIHKLIKEAFAKKEGEEELVLKFFKRDDKREAMKKPKIKMNPTKKQFHSDIDVAIVSRVNLPLVQEISDNYNRFVPFCDFATKVCYISAHLPYTETDEELLGRCENIGEQVQKLNQSGYTKILMAGDFNTDANRMATVCKKALEFANAKTIIHTTKAHAGNSCSTNKGDVTEKNIDILIEVNF